MKVNKKLVFLGILFLLHSCVDLSIFIKEPTQDIEQISFWLQRIDDPDKIILTTDEIKNLNRKILKTRYQGKPLSESSRKSGWQVRKIIQSDLNFLYKMKKYDINNKRLKNIEFKNIIYPMLAAHRIPKTIKTRFCLVTRPTYLRAFPTYEIIMSKPNDIPFDVLQKSFLDIGEPLALYHISRDGKWGMVLSTHSHGWVHLKTIAWTYSKTEIRNYISNSNFAMAVDWRVQVHLDKEMDIVFSTIHMGTRLPLIEKNSNCITAMSPDRDEKGRLKFLKTYIKNSKGISINYLKMTARNIAKQSFKMLGQPYSWGGAHFHTDCSSFLKVVFRTFGLDLPRNSYGQIRSLKNFRVLRKNKNTLLNSMMPFQTLLYKPDPGHIMLYVGEYENNYYVIHNKWSYKRSNGEKEEEVFIKKTLVSDMNLGETSQKGSLLNKLSYMGVLR